jgi:hypothetical protein
VVLVAVEMEKELREYLLNQVWQTPAVVVAEVEKTWLAQEQVALAS